MCWSFSTTNRTGTRRWTAVRLPTPDSVASCGGSTGSYFCAQKYALIKLLQKTDATGAYFVADNIGFGVMMYGSGSNKGGYIRFGVRRMNAANRAALIKVLKDMPVSDKGSSNAGLRLHDVGDVQVFRRR
jgi:hypothetical protein